MRHAASLLAAMEGMSRPAFRIARELANNSRSGLTVRFLSKKLDLPDEEVEYLVDINHKLLFADLTRIKIVNEGITGGNTAELSGAVFSVHMHAFVSSSLSGYLCQRGSLQLLLARNVGATSSSPQIFFPALRGFSRNRTLRCLK